MGSFSVFQQALKNIEDKVAEILQNSGALDGIGDTIGSAVSDALSSISISTDPLLLEQGDDTNANLLLLEAKLVLINANLLNVIAAINSKSPILTFTTPTKFALLSADLPAATSKLLIPANALRKGFLVYNNSTNSLYVCIENPAVAANLIDFCASNAGVTSVVKWMGPGVPKEAIYVIRNAGTGGCTGWEFT